MKINIKFTRKEKRTIFYTLLLLLSVLITIFLDKSIGLGSATGFAYSFLKGMKDD